MCTNCAMAFRTIHLEDLRVGWFGKPWRKLYLIILEIIIFSQISSNLSQTSPRNTYKRFHNYELKNLITEESIFNDDQSNEKIKNIALYSRFHKNRNDLKITTLDRKPVSIIHYTRPGSSIKWPTQN